MTGPMSPKPIESRSRVMKIKTIAPCDFMGAIIGRPAGGAIVKKRTELQVARGSLLLQGALRLLQRQLVNPAAFEGVIEEVRDADAGGDQTEEGVGVGLDAAQADGQGDAHKEPDEAGQQGRTIPDRGRAARV